MAGCVALWRLTLASIGVTNPWVVLISSILLGAGAYGGLLLWRRPPVLADVLQSLRMSSIPWLSEFAAKVDRI